MRDGFYRAVLPHYVCGFTVRVGVIIEAAPVMRWAVGQLADDYAAWARGKGGDVERIGDA